MNPGPGTPRPAACGPGIDEPNAGVDRVLNPSLVTTLVVAMAFTAGAQAQSGACDDFKAVLAARIESTGVRGYSLETVSASASVPSGAKVIATCESGARKILYRRWGAARAAPAAPTDPATTTVPEVSARPAPSALREPPSRARAASAPASAPLRIVRAADASSTAQGPLRQPVPTPGVAASEAAAVRPAAPAVIVPPPAQAGDTRGSQEPLGRRAVDFAAAHWPWLGVLVLLPAMAWVWRTHLSPYDKDGLPRGPRM